MLLTHDMTKGLPIVSRQLASAASGLSAKPAVGDNVSSTAKTHAGIFECQRSEMFLSGICTNDLIDNGRPRGVDTSKKSSTIVRL
jgi:hypothetical protein